MTAHSEPRVIKVNRSSGSAHLVTRLVNCLPAATFEMETLCRLAGIKSSQAIPTAAVECIHRPHMLINPDFAAKYCQRDEHLFLLVMHELWHIILAHTRLYPRVTPLHNIAFDAIINAGLARQFPRPEFRGFFDTLNSASVFPGLLLRPPVGWPEAPQYPPDDQFPPGTIDLLKRLYPPDSPDVHAADPLYEEILNLLRRAGLEEIFYVMPVLLGDHDRPDSEQKALNDPVFREMIDRMTGRWPDIPIVGRGVGGAKSESSTVLKSASEDARRVFARTLRRCLGPNPGQQQRKARLPVASVGGTGVLPNPHDRMIAARKKLGMESVLWNQRGQSRARIPDLPSKAHVYLDVSGSMMHILPHLLGLILPYVRSGQAEIFQFSNIVEPMPLEELKIARLRSTGGTDINCVLRHAVNAKPRIHRALILTDGYTGFPRLDLAQQVSEQNIRIHAVLPPHMSTRDQLKDIVASIVTLPPLRSW